MIVDIWPDCSLGLELKSQRKPRLSEKLGFSFQSSWAKKPKAVERNPILCRDKAPLRRSKLIPGSSWTLSLAKLKIAGTDVSKKTYPGRCVGPLKRSFSWSRKMSKPAFQACLPWLKEITSLHSKSF